MNRIRGTISEIETHDDLSLVSIDLGGVIFRSIVIETPETAPYLKTGSPVTVLFKETEVVITKQLDITISLRNRLKCNVDQITSGDLLCELTLSCPQGTIYSVITRNAVEQLGIKTEDAVLALVKTNEIMLSHD